MIQMESWVAQMAGGNKFITQNGLSNSSCLVCRRINSSSVEKQKKRDIVCEHYLVRVIFALPGTTCRLFFSFRSKYIHRLYYFGITYNPGNLYVNTLNIRCMPLLFLLRECYLILVTCIMQCNSALSG